jgi:hypothetical protein
MHTRPITALLAALALLAVTPAASLAQSPTPTPTATAAQDDGSAADPPADASKEVKAVYTDYSRDGVIDVCDHTRETLQETLDSIEADFDRDFPDFREAVKAGIQRHDKNRCGGDATATPTPTATATATASPSATASPDDGALPPASDHGGDDSGALPPATGSTPEDGSLPPSTDDGSTTQPPAATVAPPVAATTPTPVPTPAVVTRSSTDGLLVPGILIGIALLGAAALAVSAFTGRRSPRMRHAWSEAAYRTKSTWADFSDWLKLGR